MNTKIPPKVFKTLRKQLLGPFRCTRERSREEALDLAFRAGVSQKIFSNLVGKRLFYSPDNSFEIEEIRGSRGVRYRVVSYMPLSYGDP